MDTEIKAILEEKEKPEWEGRINRKVMRLNAFIWGAIFLAFALYISSLFLLGGIAIIMIASLIISLFYARSAVTRYAITKKRIIIRTGIIGSDFTAVYFDQIKNAIVNVGLIGKIFNTGTIKLDTGKLETVHHKHGSATVTVYTHLKNIDDPYKVYRIVQKSLSSRKESLYSGRADKESRRK